MEIVVEPSIRLKFRYLVVMLPRRLKRELKPLIEVADAFGAKLVIDSSQFKQSYSYPTDYLVFLNLKRLDNQYLTKNKIYSLFFHEIAHLVVKQENKFPAFNIQYIKTEDQVLAYKITALRAELYTDKLGENLMKSFFPEIKYVRNYRTKKEKEGLKAFVLETIWETFSPVKKCLSV